MDAAVNGFGNSLHNVITGNEAGNVLRGAAGNDTIFGNGGNDLLDGGRGSDHLEGGIGNDLYLVDNSGDVVVEQAGAGTDRVTSRIDYELPDNVEVLRLTGPSAVSGLGNALNNTVSGNSLDNLLSGLDGNDSLAGIGGNDTLEGGAGNDKLFGGAGDDTLDGGAGADRLSGASGNDTLTGGDGADHFIFNTALNESTNVDTITDFSAVDTVLLARAIFSGLDSGYPDPSAFHAGTAAADADDRIIYDSTTGALYYDADGNGAAAQQLFAYVAPDTDLTAGDFFVIG